MKPNFLIIQQIQRNSRKVLACIKRTIVNSWQCINKYSTKFANAYNKEIIGRITKKANKHKKCLKITCIILAIIALIIGLIMGSFKSAGAREQGVEMNYTSQVLNQKYITNDWTYTGLNGYIMAVPKQKILIQFTQNASPPNPQSRTQQVYNAIQARVTQGTKLLIQGSFSCNIIIPDNKDTNMVAFFNTFGFSNTPGHFDELEWMTYLRQKLTNMIIQYIGGQSFYSISNMNMVTALNAQCSQLYAQFGSTTFPFQISVLTLTINYPPNSFSVNNTLGIQLMKAKSLVSQLSNQYDAINAYITNNSGSINTTYVQNAAISASINSGLLEAYSFDDWLSGFDLIKSTTKGSTWPSASSSSVNLQKFMWLYFNNIYNATYRQQRIANQMNSTLSNERNLFLQQQLSIY